jgi:hypothetical protein
MLGTFSIMIKKSNQDGKSMPAIIILVVLLVAIFLLWKVGFFTGGGETPLDTETPLQVTEDSTETAAQAGDQLSPKEIEKLVEKVRDLILLPSPEEEQPLVATVVNADSLRGEQAFYRNIEEGDILMIYPSLAKALIYRPRTQKLINVGPLQISQELLQEAAGAQAGAPTGQIPAGGVPVAEQN